jgi:prepilin-type N-terminal cleavage/methylation domain-containing protein
MSNRHRAFTIIELLVVIIIVGLLIAAAAYSFNDARQNNRNTKRMGDAILISQAIDQYAVTNRGNYPQIATDATCADSLATALDLSLFPDRTIPTDPYPQISRGPDNACVNAGAKAGYTYYPRQLSRGNAAFYAKARYVIAIGLEGQKPSDELVFLAPSQVNATIGNSYPDVLSGNPPRTQYWLIGKYCGTDSQCFPGN